MSNQVTNCLISMIFTVNVEMELTTSYAYYLAVVYFAFTFHLKKIVKLQLF